MTQWSLAGRTIYIPQMSYGGIRCLSAAFQSIGLKAQLVADSDSETLELGGRYTSGDECLPERITLGDFLKITRLPDFEPAKTAFFMPTAGGPCRFGQYEALLRKVLKQLGLEEVMVFSPTSSNAYDDIGGQSFIRTGWRALVASDALQKLLLRTRPYEVSKGETDELYEDSLKRVCEVLSLQLSHKDRLRRLVATMAEVCQGFRHVPTRPDPQRPLIGVVGEIYCRHSFFSNDNLIRKVEEHGGEAWLSDLAEWVWYTISDERRNLRMAGRRFSKAMLGSYIRARIQRSDEHAVFHPLQEYLCGYEEPEDIGVLLGHSEPYLPFDGALGEMVLSVGKTIYLYEKGADGIIDISPFTCMNGIVCEAIYPHVSRDHEGIPIRNFYFDGTAMDLDRDIGIFIELARNYQRKKSKLKGRRTERSH